MKACLMSRSDAEVPRETLEARLRRRAFHLYFRLRRPMTLGVRGLVLDRTQNSVFLIRHTYVPGWQLPGGGVETGETLEQALGHELREEGNIVVEGRPRLFAVYFNRHASPRDHVALYVVENFTQSAPKAADREIAEAGFFSLDRLPESITEGTRRRIREVVEGLPPTEDW